MTTASRDADGDADGDAEGRLDDPATGRTGASAASGGRVVTEGLVKAFGDVVAVDDVSVTFEPGECHALIGPNGSGKTTLFDLITGFQRPDSGTVRFDGAAVTGRSPDRLARDGLVRTFQIAAPFDALTVRENLHAVYAGGLGAGVRVSTATRERAAELLSVLDLAHVADQPAGELSGGQQQLLELGRAMMLDPACLLLDEPTAGVTPAVQERVLATLRDLTDAGTTLAVVEHDLSVVADLADRVTVLADGRVLSQGSFEAVTTDERVRDAYVGTRTDRDPAAGTGPGRPGTGATAEPTGPASAAEPTGAAPASERGAVDVDSEQPATVDVDSEQPATVDVDPEQAAALSGDGEPDRLVARDVTAGYGNHVVLDGVSVRSHDGVTCVFGPNGSGKSTLLKALAGVVPVRSGAVEYGGESITGLAPHEVVAAGITTVPQRERVFGGLTVRENLQLGATTVDDDAVAAERTEAVLDVFPALAASLGDPARSLSGGQQVMLALARAMMTGADVYLLDEPLGGLAPAAVEDVFAVLETLVDRGVQVVLVEQHVREAMRVADHVYVLSQGEIRFDGAPGDLDSEDALLDRYLGLD